MVLDTAGQPQGLGPLLDLWSRLTQLTGSEDVDGILEYWERAYEAKGVLETSQLEAEARKRRVEQTLSQVQRAEDARQQAAAEAESFSGDTRLKETERALYVKELENERLRERASNAEMLHRTTVEQLDGMMRRVTVAAKARPADVARASTSMRQEVIQQQILFESMEHSGAGIDVTELTTRRAQQLCTVLAGWVTLLASIRMAERLPAFSHSRGANLRSGPTDDHEGGFRIGTVAADG